MFPVVIGMNGQRDRHDAGGNDVTPSSVGRWGASRLDKAVGIEEKVSSPFLTLTRGSSPA